MTGKIASIARNMQIPCRIFANVSDLERRLKSPEGETQQDFGGEKTLWLIDLQRNQEDWPRVRELAQLMDPPAQIVGYAQHVLPHLIEEAQLAGFDRVLTRGKFDRQVASLIEEFAAHA